MARLVSRHISTGKACRFEYNCCFCTASSRPCPKVIPWSLIREIYQPDQPNQGRLLIFKSRNWHKSPPVHVKAEPQQGNRIMWSILLDEPIRLDNGQVLRTLEDVRRLIASIPRDLARHEKWQTLASLVVDVGTACDADMVDLVSDRLKHALETPPFAAVRLMPRNKEHASC
jgi:hypothetical protein